MSDGRTKVAILGGGAGALTAAFDLTATDELRRRFDVTVYQMGWRLGGKGASGRDMRPGYGHRIQEHGLHIWMGFYYNAFKVMEQAYAELGRPKSAPLATWDEAFKPQNLITLVEQIDGRWITWPIEFPNDGGAPGDGSPKLDAWQHLQLLLGWIEEILSRHLAEERRKKDTGDGTPSGFFAELEKAVDKVESWVGLEVLRAARAVVVALEGHPSSHSPADHQRAASHLRRFRDELWKWIEKFVEEHTDLRRLWIMLDISSTVAIGLLEDGVFTGKEGFDALDRYELREWLLAHGLTQLSVWSAPIRAIYDLAFGYRDGIADAEHADMAAGATLRGMLRMTFGYKGAIFFKMQAGMGDTVFTPLYQVLERRGVRFEFFQKVEELIPAEDGSRIEEIRIQRQATVKPEVQAHGGYDPLVDVLDLPCWPQTPLFDQLVEGETLSKREIDLESAWADWPGVGEHRLRRGVDFDEVVLGISLGALDSICARLLLQKSKWRRMVDDVKTVRTQAFQLWLSWSAEQLGWVSPERACLGAYVEPLDTWADMSQLLPREDWPAADTPLNVSYFCGPMDEEPPTPPLGPDPRFPRAVLASVAGRARQYARQNLTYLWPKAGQAGNPAALDWNLLIDPEARSGAARFDAQFFRANVDPSERYVLSVKGSTASRLPSGDSGYPNLVLAGDWTRNGLNVGCVECAVMGGLGAARALRGEAFDIAGEVDVPKPGGS